ncbi:hypothetical protein DLAC_05698 [Tieghemostelium lacteum]|uniref:Uncharacterized protein n=1 Tax=Tieghemostelium lacteum TaxID=361077 RepID=A0A151ZGH5_TIELA|nr:hypothetical protein DLAC_05698 [Tieghemostelium lacteum]|eukprot:KYQ93078.1 hypothetical protein DLAC_05698 [Tieghemostelium lacteum]
MSQPPQQPYGAYPPQQYGAYPPQQQQQQYGAYPPQQYGAYPPQQYGAYPPQQYGAYPPQQYGAYPPQQYGAYPPQQYAGYPPQQYAGYGQPTTPTPVVPGQPTTPPTTTPLTTTPTVPPTGTPPSTSTATTPVVPGQQQPYGAYPPQQYAGYPPQQYASYGQPTTPPTIPGQPTTPIPGYPTQAYPNYPPQQPNVQQPVLSPSQQSINQLSVTARKSLRDNEEHLKTAMEKIKTALGVEWQIEFDFAVLLEKATDSQKNSCGETFYKDIAGAIAFNISENSTYWKCQWDNGTLQLIFKDFNCNINDIRYFKLSNITPTPGVYSLNARINLKKNKDKIDESIDRIKSSTKNDGWSLDEQSLEEVYPLIDSSKDSIGEYLAEVLNRAANNICDRNKDPMTLEAFIEATPGLKIVLKTNKKQDNYWTINFEKGNLNITGKQWNCNISDVQYYNWEKLL